MYRIDKIDSEIRCIGLRWWRTSAPPGHHTSAAKYGLIPIESICGFFHIVRKVFVLSILDETHPLKPRTIVLSNTETG